MEKAAAFILYKVETDWNSVKTPVGAQVPQQQAACVLRELGDQSEMSRILLTIGKKV